MRVSASNWEGEAGRLWLREGKRRKEGTASALKVRKVHGAKYLQRGSDVPPTGYPVPFSAPESARSLARLGGCSGVQGTVRVPARRYTC